MMGNLSIKELSQGKTTDALRLAWNVFQEYEVPDYTKEGVEEFYRSIHDESYLSQLCFYGAFVQEGGKRFTVYTNGTDAPVKKGKERHYGKVNSNIS